MQYSYDPTSRLARLLFSALMALVWAGAPAITLAQSQSGSSAGAADDQQIQVFVDQIDHVMKAVEAADRRIPRETFSSAAIVEKVGHDPAKLFEWVRDNTWWVPYQGSLRGPVGVLMDRLGNSLDRSLLLARLLATAGQNVRVAHATLTEARASELLGRLRAVPSQRLAASDFSDQQVNDQLTALARESELDPAKLQRVRSKSDLEESKLAEQMVQRVSDQAPAVQAAVGRPASPPPKADEAAAIRDHWWVQRQDGANWLDLDVLLPDAQPGKSAALPSQLFACDPQGNIALPAGLAHQVRLRVVIERLDAGKRSTGTVLDLAMSPADLLGQRVLLTQYPLDWPGDDVANDPDMHHRLVALTAKQHEWMPILMIGQRRIVQGSFSDTGTINPHPNPDPMARFGASTSNTILGAAAALDAPSEPAKPAGVLTAEWLEYEITAPGQPMRSFRRDVFDVLGAAARETGKIDPISLTEPQLVDRGLRLLGGVQLLALPCELSGDFVAHLSDAALLSSRGPLTAGVKSIAQGKNRLGVQQLQTASPMPGPLYDLALLRHALGRQSAEFYYDHANLFTFRWGPRIEGGKAKICGGIDIVENGLGIRPGSNVDPFAARIEQGVLDTNAEALVVTGCGQVLNAAELFQMRTGGPQWMLARSPQDPALKSAEFPPETRTRIERELRAGYLVLAPTKPVALQGRPFVGWWRIDPATGQTLGIGDSGEGTAMTEYAFLIVNIALCGLVAFLDTNGLTVQDAVVCVLMGAAAGAGAGVGAAKGLSMAARVAIVASELGTGLWLNNSPGMQHSIVGGH